MYCLTKGDYGYHRLVLIVYGTKRIEKTRGEVADYCPICRAVRAFRLVRIGLASHVYYISFGSGKLVCHLIECRTCSVWVPVDPIKYAKIEKAGAADLATLEHATNPRLLEDHAERIAVDTKLQSSPTLLSPEERGAWMLEPFRLLNPKVELRFKSSTQFDRSSSIGCVGTLLLTIAFFWFAATSSPPMQDYLLFALFGTLAIGGIYTLLQLHFAPARFVKAKIAPVLVSALRPLYPTQEELEGVLFRCKTAGMKIGSQIKPDWLWLELQRHPGEALRH